MGGQTVGREGTRGREGNLQEGRALATLGTSPTKIPMRIATAHPLPPRAYHDRSNTYGKSFTTTRQKGRANRRKGRQLAACPYSTSPTKNTIANLAHW